MPNAFNLRMKALATLGIGDINYEKGKPWVGKSGEWSIIDCRHIEDGPGNDLDKYKYLIDKGYELLLNDEKVLCVCMAGMSRSNAIAVGILMKYLGVSYETANNLVHRKIRPCLIEPAHEKALKKLESLISVV